MDKYRPGSWVRYWTGGLHWKRDEGGVEYQRARDQNGDIGERSQQDGQGELTTTLRQLG